MGMGLPRPELAGWEETCTTGGGTSKVGTGMGDGKRNLLQEMGHPRETNLPHDMGLPRPELAGTETRRRIYRGRCDIQGWNWQVGRWEEEFST